MNEAHSILHDIKSLLGIGQCTSTQAIGICLEFWVGALVAVGALKIKKLYAIKNSLSQQVSGKKRGTDGKKKKSKVKYAKTKKKKRERR